MYPADLPRYPARDDVSDVVFVIHGIRDQGYWTHKIARRVQAEGERLEGAEKKVNKVYETVTSSYGYFAMLPFFLPSARRAKVEWLMDQYAEARALYPKAAFSFVGHSNGTYLLTKALQDYPCCRFKHVVFAGSVVQRRYDWSRFIESGQVKAVLNYVATNNWIVACFPKALELLRLQDLGSAGHDGFNAASNEPSVYDVKFVKGAHSAALKEENWDSIAHFIVHGTPALADLSQPLPSRSWLVAFTGAWSPLIWLLLLAVLGGFGVFIYLSPWPEWARAVSLVAYIWLIWKFVTKV